MSFVDFLQMVSPSVYQNGIDGLFSVIIFVTSILLLIIFAKTVSVLLDFWQYTFETDYDLYDKVRLIGGLIIMIFALSFNYFTINETDFDRSLGYLGIACSLYGIGVSILLSLMSDKKLKQILTIG
jgi:hypothetical protein